MLKAHSKVQVTVPIAGVCPLYAVSESNTFQDNVNDILQKRGLTESAIFSGDFNTHILRRKKNMEKRYW